MHLHRIDHPLTLGILSELLDRRGRLPDGYERTDQGAWVDWDALSRSYLSSTEIAVVHIAHGCSIAERHGGLPPATVPPVHQSNLRVNWRPGSGSLASIWPAIPVPRREPGGLARLNRPRDGTVMAEVTHLDRVATPGAMAILENLVGGHERPPVAYEATAAGAWVDWDQLIKSPILSSGELAAVHIARGCALAERVGGLPTSGRSSLLTAITRVATGRREVQS
jgi:hypothetical protein